MFYSYIEYINSENQLSKKEIGNFINAESAAEKIFSDEYILEYMYMPQALLIMKFKKLTVARYKIGKIDNKLFLIST